MNRYCFCAETSYGEVNINQQKKILENLKKLLTKIIKYVII